jgi:photosystem I P700 chlorophyll a apoprotein A2
MVTTLGMNNLAVWAWMFLFGHLVWATDLCS